MTTYDPDSNSMSFKVLKGKLHNSVTFRAFKTCMNLDLTSNYKHNIFIQKFCRKKIVLKQILSLDEFKKGTSQLKFI